MRRIFVALVAGAALAAPSAYASRAFSGNPCHLVSAKHLASVGVAGSCKPTTLHGPGFTNSTAVWSLTPTQHLSVAVNTYPSASGAAWSVAMKTLRILPGGQGKKVSGIGSLAYEAGGDGSTGASINFVVGKQIVAINLGAKKAPSMSAFNALAKSVAAKLQ